MTRFKIKKSLIYDMIDKSKKERTKEKWENWIVGTFVALVILYFIFNTGFESSASETKEKVNNIQKLENILKDYSSSHTYSLTDLFVCTDTSIDVWNLVKTEGINAQICVGNVEENISDFINESDYETVFNFFNKINHAWVIAEFEPFKWIALETTGGYLVWGENSADNLSYTVNELYYNGICFDNPKEFKEFLNLRESFFDVCGKAIYMETYWKENYVGKIRTDEATKYEGQMEQKEDECIETMNQLSGLIV